MLERSCVQVLGRSFFVQVQKTDSVKPTFKKVAARTSAEVDRIKARKQWDPWHDVEVSEELRGLLRVVDLQPMAASGWPWEKWLAALPGLRPGDRVRVLWSVEATFNELVFAVEPAVDVCLRRTTQQARTIAPALGMSISEEELDDDEEDFEEEEQAFEEDDD